jgi:hypothetical protein
MGESITKLDKDNGIQLQTISDMKDNNKPKFMKYARNCDSGAGLSKHQKGNAVILSCGGSTRNEKEHLSVIFLLHVQKGTYVHEALGLEGGSGLYWKGLPTEPPT